MAVLWCKDCGELIGVREPLTDWAMDLDVLCPSCAIQKAVPRPPGSERAGDKDATEPPAGQPDESP
jgi:hypothetical protein